MTASTIEKYKANELNLRVGKQMLDVETVDGDIHGLLTSYRPADGENGLDVAYIEVTPFGGPKAGITQVVPVTKVVGIDGRTVLVVK